MNVTPSARPHTEAEVRASMAFQVSKLAAMLARALRVAAGQEPWDVLVPGGCRWGRWAGRTSVVCQTAVGCACETGDSCCAHLHVVAAAATTLDLCAHSSLLPLPSPGEVSGVLREAASLDSNALGPASSSNGNGADDGVVLVVRAVQRRLPARSRGTT